MSDKYVTLQEWAEAWDVSARTARRYLGDGLLAGAHRQGRAWRIPIDSPAPNTRPAHMRPAPRVIPGEIVQHSDDTRPNGVAIVTPEAPLAAPEAPLVRTGGPCEGACPHHCHVWAPLRRPFVSLDDMAALCAPVISRKSLAGMLHDGELKGHRRGPSGGWVIPTAEILRLVTAGGE